MACVYRPPDLPNGRTRQLLEDAESILPQHPEFDHVLMGDLNIDLSERSYSPLKSDLVTFCNVTNLSIKVNDYTRVAHRTWQDGTVTTSRTTIDVILCSPSENYSIEPPADISISDHRLIKSVSNHRCSVPVHKTITVVNWKRGNLEQLLADTRTSLAATSHSSPVTNHKQRCLR